MWTYCTLSGSVSEANLIEVQLQHCSTAANSRAYSHDMAFRRWTFCLDKIKACRQTRTQADIVSRSVFRVVCLQMQLFLIKHVGSLLIFNSSVLEN